MIVCDGVGPQAGDAGAGGVSCAEVSVLVASSFLAFLCVVEPLGDLGVAAWACTRFRHADFDVVLFSVLQ